MATVVEPAQTSRVLSRTPSAEVVLSADGTVSKRPVGRSFSPDYLERQRALMKVDHPGVVRPSSVHDDEVVMPWVDGISLERLRLLARGRGVGGLPPSVEAWVAEALCRAVRAAHEVMSSAQPSLQAEHVFVSPQGEVRWLVTGASQVQRAGPKDDDLRSIARLLESGGAAEDEALRSTIEACLTAPVASRYDTVAELQQLLEAWLQGQAGPSVAEAVAWAMGGAPSSALASWLATNPGPRSPSRSRAPLKRARVALALAGALVALVAVGGGALFWPGPASAPDDEDPSALPTPVALVSPEPPQAPESPPAPEPPPPTPPESPRRWGGLHGLPSAEPVDPPRPGPVSAVEGGALRLGVESTLRFGTNGLRLVPPAEGPWLVRLTAKGLHLTQPARIFGTFFDAQGQPLKTLPVGTESATVAPAKANEVRLFVLQQSGALKRNTVGSGLVLSVDVEAGGKTYTDSNVGGLLSVEPLDAARTVTLLAGRAYRVDVSGGEVLAAVYGPSGSDPQVLSDLAVEPARTQVLLKVGQPALVRGVDRLELWLAPTTSAGASVVVTPATPAESARFDRPRLRGNAASWLP